MERAAGVTAVILAAALFSESAFALTTDDVMSSLCRRKMVKVRGCRVRIYYMPRRCEHGFGLPVQG
jgi:hypothetical protein